MDHKGRNRVLTLRWIRRNDVEDKAIAKGEGTRSLGQPSLTRPVVK